MDGTLTLLDIEWIMWILPRKPHAIRSESIPVSARNVFVRTSESVLSTTIPFRLRSPISVLQPS
jgi:hypothetical protein